MTRRIIQDDRSMKVKRMVMITALLLLPCLVLISCGCTTSSGSGQSGGIDTSRSSSPVEKVEVYHFHATRQCYSCVTLGAYAEETVNTCFAPEVQSGKVVFAHINMDLPENTALVERYGPTGSSLWIGVYDRDGFHKEEDLTVWYKVGNKDEYMAYLKEVIDKRLAGDFS
jgi:predicted small secreted protein